MWVKKKLIIDHVTIFLIYLKTSTTLKESLGTSLAVQWLRPCASNAGDTVQIPSWGTRFHMLCSAAKKYF